MTPTQQGILFQSRHGGRSGLYHVQVVLEVAQELDVETFRRSWAHAVDRHAALRTSVTELPGGESVQRVSDSVDVPCAYEDWSDAGERCSERMQALLRRDHAQGFALDAAPLWRLYVCRLGEARFQVLWSLHYLLLDARSQSRVLREVEQAYDRLAAGDPLPVRPAAQFGEYVGWLSRQDADRSEAFWRDALDGVPSARPLPVELRPSADEETAGDAPAVAYEQVPLVLDAAQTAALRDAGARQGLTLTTLVQGAWAFLLSRYLGTDEVVTGVTTSGRSAGLAGVDAVVGQLVNTLPLRAEVPPAMGWAEWMRGIQRQYEQIRAHEDSPLLLVQQWSGIGSGESLFDSVVTVEEPEETGPAGGLRMVRSWEESHPGYPLSMVATPGERLTATLHYDTGRFAAPTVERMAGHLRRVLADLVEKPEAGLGELTLLTEAESTQLVHDWNDTDTPYTRDLCLHQLFERRVAQDPDAPALLCEDERWTYREVNEQANRIAHHLKQLGIRRGDQVAILMGRSAEMVPALLGILKAGAAYIPLDANAPVKRWHQILDSMGVPCVLTQHALLPRLQTVDPLPALAHVVCLDTTDDDAETEAGLPWPVHSATETAGMPRENPPVQGGPQDLAYIIFTSGSTGTPKGVMVRHSPAVNLIEWVNKTFSVGSEDRILFVTSLSFDLSVYDVFGILAAGGQIRVATSEDIQEPANLLRYIAEEPITFWDSAPAALMQLVPFLATDGSGVPDPVSHTLRLIFMSGDWIPVHSPDLMRAAFPHVQVVGLGGATEATVWSNFFPIGEVDPAWTSIPYGKPIQNARYYVLDESLRPCPLDVPGDLYIGGPCLSDGYAHAPELTAGKYVPSPFHGAAGERVYKTGDMARWRPDGNLEFLGRTDSQVKIRGYRVELGEIDGVLSEHPAVQDAATIVREDQTGTRALASYVVLHPQRAQEAVQEREEALADKRVDHWREVYDAFDSSGERTEDGADFSGWSSSYTGRPIPVEEMRAWQDDTVTLIRGYEPRTILEIGCGTGLLLFPLATGCRRYYGMDFSSSALKSVRNRLGSRPELRETVALRQGEADDVGELDVEPVDTVVVNSVVQYFPDVDYLVRVLEGALTRAADDGRIIVGDVRSFPLLDAFHAGVEASRAPDAMTRQQLRQRVQHRVQQEEELTLDPAFFRDWAASTGRISRVEIRPKRGRHHNELTMFRYQVVLHLGTPATAGEEDGRDQDGTELDWAAEVPTLADLRARLTGESPERLRLYNVPNARVEEAVRTLRWLKGDAGLETVEAWRAQPGPDNGVEPEDVFALAEQTGYTAALDWGRHGADGGYAVVLTRAGVEPRREEDERIAQGGPVGTRDWASYANQPLKGEIQHLLLPRLSGYLTERLPAYMVPSDLVALDALPITPSGKLDRRALLSPPTAATAESRVPARNTTEALLVTMWEQVLGRSPIGVFDDFFELGGHSLLAVQLVSRVRQVFCLEVPVRLFFDLPTIAEIGRELQRRQEELQPVRMPPLTPAGRGRPLPATFDQQRLFFIDRLSPGTSSYTVNWLIPLPTSVEQSVVSDALREMTRRHEPLRTTLREEDGRVWQVIADEQRLDLPVTDLSALPEEQAEAQAQDEIRRWWAQPFDVVTGPLVRARLIRTSRTEQVLVLAAHHTVFDGYSIGVFDQEFLQICRALTDGEPSPLPDLAVQYADYAVWQQSWLEETRLAFHLDYWKEQLAEAPEVLSLPTDFPRPGERSFAGDFVRRQLSPATTRRITEVSRGHQVTNYLALLSGFAVFLARYSGQEVVVIGVPVADRNRVELESMVGFLVNTVAVRVDLRGDPSFADVLLQVRKQLFDAQTHREVPFEQVVEALQPARSLAYNPVFQVMFADESLPYLEHAAQLARPKPWIHNLMEQGMSVGVARFDLTLMIQADPAGMRFGFEYSTDLFRAETVGRMADHFEALVEAALARPDTRVQHLPMAAEAERDQLVEKGHGLRTDRALRHGTLHELFTACARRNAQSVAVVCGESRLSYAELDRLSNRLAHLLRERGVGRESLVGLCVSRSVETIVGQLAILKAGGAYVPLDPEYPPERLAFMIEDGGLRTVLTRRSMVASLPVSDASVLVVDDVWDGLDDRPDTPVASGGTPDDLAYVMYTSGSTGRPKGVAVTHGDVAALAYDSGFAHGHQGVLLHSAQAFDASTYELWVPLLSGHHVVVAPPGAVTPTVLRECSAAHGVTAVWLTAALFHLLAQEDPGCMAGLREVWTGGDAVRADAVRRVREACPGLVVVDGYGPTETTTFATAYRMEPRDEVPETVPIGRPLDDMQVYVLDHAMQPVPTGVAGELYIGGAGLARGYLGLPDLTAQSFVPDPFGTGGRLYRTGDLARFRPDGNVEFLGRADDQVKIRGFRVELGEIETVLLRHPEVRAAAVLAQGEGSKRLVAFVVGGESVATEALQSFLGERLPHYMVPGVFVPLESMPLNASDKVDRKALAALSWREHAVAEQEHVAPRTPVEEELAQIWQAVLGTAQPVGVHDNFFSLGGDSILSLQVIFRAKQQGLYFTVKQLFRYQTITELAPVVEHQDAPPVQAEQGLVTGPVPLTPIQHWFFEQGFAHPHHVNQSLLLDVDADVTPQQWEQVLRGLLEQHDGLRTRFFHQNGTWQAELAGLPTQLPWQVHDLTTVPADQRRTRLLEIAGQTQSSMHLTEPPLLRAALFTGVDDQGPRLLLVAHHLVVDVVSWRVLLEDLGTLVEQARQGQEPQLPAKSTSWRQWAQQLHQEATSPATLDELPYWHEQAQTPYPLPLDGPRGHNTIGRSQTYEAVLDATETRALLQDIPAVFHTRINDVLLTAVTHTLGTWTGHDHIRYDLEGHGREELSDNLDTSRTTGWFTTISPLHLPVPTTLTNGLKQIKELLRARPRHGIGYGLLAHTNTHTATTLHTATPAQISFNYLGQFDQTLATSFNATTGLAGPDWHPDNHRPYLIDIVSHIHNGRLHMQWTHDNNTHTTHTIQHLAENTLETLRDLAQEAGRPGVQGYSPSDLPLSGLNQEQIDALVEQLRTLPAWRTGASPRPLEDCYPQTPTQEGLWFQSRFAQGEGAYHVQQILRLDQALDVDAFRRSWAEVMRRHPILRTSFRQEADEALQLVWADVPVPLEEQDWRAAAPQEQQERLRGYLEHDRVRSFDPDDVPQWRMLLARTADDAYQLVLSAHHTILDGWSISLVLSDLVQWYEAATHGGHIEPAPVRPYRDYVSWLRRQDMGQAEEYWRTALQGLGEPTPLEVGKRADAEGDAPAAQAWTSTDLSEAEAGALQDFAARHRLTLNTVLQGCWALLLSRYARTDDVVFGTVTSGRPSEVEGVERMVGLFINTLPLRVRLPDQAPVLDWLHGLQEQNVQMRQHEHCPLGQIQQWTETPAGAPLFETLFVFENYPEDERRGKALSFSEMDSQEQTHYPLNTVITVGRRIGVNLLYDTRRFDARTAEAMIGHLRQLCHEVVTAPQRPLGQVTMLTDGELPRALNTWASETTSDVEAVYYHELVTRQARSTPDSVAVVHEDEHLTYAELERRSDRLAHWLKRHGVGPDVLVGLCLERSTESVVGMLGILKAGGAYVPIDPRYPRDRMAFVVEDAGLHLMLTQEHVVPKLPEGDFEVFCMDSEWATVAQEPVGAPATTLTPHNLAYIIYTSGSTGRPKGVMVAHRCIHHLVPWIRRNPCFDRRQRVLQVASTSFDFSVWEILMPLVTGGTVYIPGKDVRMIGTELHDVLDERAIESLNFTPGALATLPTDEPLPHLRTLVVGGEAYSADLIRTWAPGRTFFNVYGPTESTVFATGGLTDEHLDVIHMGRPITNVRLYVLDQHMRPVPVGVPGELYIGGVGVTRGYMNRPDLTAENFVADPFGDEPGGRLYKSGDLVRYLADGNIEFVDRVDSQVKIRGFRIELGEIETVLEQHPLVRGCAVLAQPDGGGKRLVGYVVPHEETPDATDVLRAHLREQLPSYMVPSAFVYLHELPLNSNGKLNRKVLPLPEETEAPESSTGALPRTSTEAQLAAVWQEVLDQSRVGVFDDFFSLGGHSLLAVKVQARIRQAFEVEMPVRVLFEQPTIAQVAAEVDALLRHKEPHDVIPLVPVERDKPIPATFEQQRLWYLDRLHPDSPLYTVGWLLHRSEAVDAARLTSALEALVERHETLRTTFRESGGRVWQEIAESGQVVLTEADLSGEPVEQRPEAARERARELWKEPFDLATGPLLRTLLIHLADNESLLVFSAHHAIVDGFSLPILNEELLRGYDDLSAGRPATREPLPVQYADYAVWQQQWREEDRLRPHLEFWKGQLAEAPALISLPTDRPRPAVQDFEGASVSVSLPAELGERVARVSAEHQTTQFVALLSAFAVLLSHYSGQDKVVIGIPVANRSRVETEPLIGFLVNTVALCVDLSGNPDFSEVVGQVRWKLLEAQSHQEVPFDRIVEELKPERSLSYSPVFQVMFTGLDKLFEDVAEEQEQPSWEQDMVEAGIGVSKFDLGLSVQKRDGALRLTFEYSTALFERNTVAGMGEHLRLLTEAALREPRTPVARLPLLTAAERTEVLDGRNATRDEAVSRPTTLHHLFEEQARRTPDRIALSYEEGQLSYAQLDRLANRLAHTLRERGVTAEARVGISLHRSLDLVIALLATLKAQGAYVPLDPDYPADRIAYIAEDAAVQLVLVQPGTREQFGFLAERGVELVELGGADDGWLQTSEEPVDAPVHPDNLAYLIYTSGSTGRPKGAMLSHRGICNRLLWMQSTYDLHEDDRVLQKTPFSFDVSVWEFFWPLIAGARLHVARPDGHRDAGYLGELIEQQHIRVLHFVPSMLQGFLAQRTVTERCQDLRHVICSGEALPLEVQEQCMRTLPQAQLHNLYGPTEASVDVSFWECVSEPGASSVPIGRPVANTQLYVLNEAMAPVPDGVVGELFIGGVQLARGYLGRPDLTAERFVANPFGDGRLYATGDLARFRADGVIEYAGRKDHQIKIRGYRIEIDEVEAVLADHPTVRQCLVVVHEVTSADKRLIAFVTARDGREAVTDDLRAHLLERLPEYMVPAYFVPLEGFPLTPNGKIDRKALPALGDVVSQVRTGESYVAPRTDTEAALAGIWARLLGLERVGSRDDFFALGGHSLLVASMATEVQDRWGVELKLPVVFQNRTIAALAQVIDHSAEEDEEADADELFDLL
ncbi:non-ribosomal peptide synthetase [Streptomyces diacarni]|uniref:non-ribosomal peptide synthetase n=1 Tax=Streptomyces diacarni TaxID=2800381 RepID=UPI0015F11C13|nr:non-ribosomal peptide synthetase [Streptomyces diacarni]